MFNFCATGQNRGMIEMTPEMMESADAFYAAMVEEASRMDDALAAALDAQAKADAQRWYAWRWAR